MRIMKTWLNLLLFFIPLNLLAQTGAYLSGGAMIVSHEDLVEPKYPTLTTMTVEDELPGYRLSMGYNHDFGKKWGAGMVISYNQFPDLIYDSTSYKPTKFSMFSLDFLAELTHYMDDFYLVGMIGGARYSLDFNYEGITKYFTPRNLVVGASAYVPMSKELHFGVEYFFTSFASKKIKEENGLYIFKSDKILNLILVSIKYHFGS